MNNDQAELAINLAQNRSIGIAADDPTTRQFLTMIIKYVGAQASCLITTAANNSIASAVGAAGSEAADANFTVGSTPGTIDLTNAGADTMGEVADFINGLADYECRLVGCLRADDADTTAALVAVTSAQAKVSGGLGLAPDTSVAKNLTFEASCLDGGLANSGNLGEAQVGLNNDNRRVSVNSLLRVAGTLTYTGADSFKVYEVDDENKTAALIYQQLISVVIGASTVAGSTAFPNSGIVAGNGKRMVVRLAGASSFAVTNFDAQTKTVVLV